MLRRTEKFKEQRILDNLSHKSLIKTKEFNEHVSL